MLILDSAGVAATLVALLSALLRAPSEGRIRLTGLVAASSGTLALVLHLLFEGARWQMMPAYITAFPALALAITLHRAPGMHGLVRWLLAICLILPLSISTLLSVAFPVFRMPVPDGAHPVGTSTAWLLDRARSDPYRSGQREIEVQIWYPAAPAADSKKRAPYWWQPLARSYATLSRAPLPWFTFTHLGLVQTHSQENAPPLATSGRLPVVLYSHGTGIGWASSNTVLAESLASHGYVVIGIGHTSIGSLTFLSDGSAVPFDAATGDAMALEPGPEALALRDQLQESRNWQEQVLLYAEGMEHMPPAALAAVGVALDTTGADQRFILTELRKWMAGSRGGLIVPDSVPVNDKGLPAWTALVDANRAGVIGQSLGGCAAFETCVDDPNCRAGVNLDGFHPRQIGRGLDDAAFLFLNREEHLLYGTNFEASTAPVHVALVSRVTHFNFFDFAIMSPLYKRLGLLGELGGYESLATTAGITRAFYDAHLRDARAVQWPQDMPHVEFASKNVVVAQSVGGAGRR